MSPEERAENLRFVYDDLTSEVTEHLTRPVIAAAIREAVAEAIEGCAKVADTQFECYESAMEGEGYPEFSELEAAAHVARDIAATIRERKS